ncbi:MAG: heterodisulfide reductase-related iron-sulfur binding cluster [Firmicutes bacterium]|nr:heterodisulfide reductase-related iron-sulfur binding cluster [Bacillota bacterium]
MRETWDACLKCTLCVSQCPVVSVNTDFPGPKALGPEWYRRWQASPGEVMNHVHDCTFCQLCEAACPVAVPVAHLIAEHKAHALSQLGWRNRLRDSLLARPHRVGQWMPVGTVPPLVRRWGGLSRRVRFPSRRRGRVAELGPALSPPRGVVGLVQDCYSRAYDPELVNMAAALLRLWGYQVRLLPKSPGCCGAAAMAQGRPALAHRLAGGLWAQLAREGQGCDVLVTLNATCDGTVRDEWARDGFGLSLPVRPFDALAMEAPAAFWERLRLFSMPDSVWLTHTTCRGKVARGDGHLLALAARAGFPSVRPVDAACCGAGGSYAFKAEHEATAEALAEAIRRQVAEEGAVAGIITDSGTCALHIEDATGVATHHPAYWLYHRYRESLGEGPANERKRS